MKRRARAGRARAAAKITRTARALRIRLRTGSEVTFALKKGCILGITHVRQDKVPLRNPERPWRPVVTTPEGIHYAEFVLTGVKRLRGGGVRIEAEARGVRTLVREEQDEYLGDVLDLSAQHEVTSDRFAWILQPSALVLDEKEFSGFSFQYEYRSSDPKRKLYRLFDDATWEIGGRVAGNTLFCQGQCNPPLTSLRRNLNFTTACNYYGAEMKPMEMGPEQRVSFQRLPRIGTLQAFDFLCHRAGVLFGRFDPLEEVMSVIQKKKGEDCLHVVDELRRPMAARLRTHPKHILFHRTERAWPIEQYKNLWTRAYDMVHDELRARHGIRPSPVQPRVWLPQISGETAHFGATSVPRARFLYHLADNAVPLWADMGVREICAFSLWVTDYTVDRKLCKDDSGLHGALMVGSICNVRVHEVDPLWGGEKALAYFVDKAHRRGMQVQLWWASHLSRRAPIFTERPDFMLMARDGLPNGGGYGHQTIITADLANPDCADWIFGNLKAVHEATGFDGLFHDSYGNMTFLPVNYADQVRRGQQEAYARFVHRLQKTGVESFTVEGIGPWGVGHFGMDLLPAKRAPGSRFQNAFDWWIDHPDMVYRLNIGIGAKPWPGKARKAQEVAFRCMAAGGRFGFTEHEDGIEVWRGWLREQNRLHARLGPLFGRRTLLPQDRGVLWERENGDRLIFAFRSFVHRTDVDTDVCEVTADGEIPVQVRSGVLRAKPWRVYRLRGMG